MSEEICFFAHLIVTLQIISAKLFRFDKKEPFLYSRLFKKKQRLKISAIYGRAFVVFGLLLDGRHNFSNQ